MELKIDTGALRIPILRDGQQTGELRFSPKDVNFVQGFYDLYASYEALAEQYSRRAGALKPEDDEGYFALLRELGEAVRAGIDKLFGAGTSDAAFGAFVGHPDVYAQFFEGLLEVITHQRQAELAPYLPRQEAETEGDGLV